jgi:hypothetical protein
MARIGTNAMVRLARWPNSILIHLRNIVRSPSMCAESRARWFDGG